MITIDNLTKRYGHAIAVDDVSFVAEAGRVTGFLGPNGAGKSTTMRMLVGLTQPTSGTARVAGRRFADLPNPGLEVGVMLDASAQHAGRTGREILTVAQWTMGVPARRVDEMLELVSLTPTEADRRVGNYSLGMRQRLGIATALIGNPAVLVLDEPANGLDPAGIRWMRDLLRDFADRGGTVLLSSHLLREVEIVADDIVMIGGGRIVCQGTKADLLRGVGSVVRAADVPALRGALHAAGADTTISDDGAVATDAPPDQVGEVASGRAWPSPSCEQPTADWRTCSSSSPPTPNETREAERGEQHDHHHPAVPGQRVSTRVTGLPLARVVRVELRKMFNTRSGFWLMASIVIIALVTMVGTVLFAPDEDLTYYTFAKAIGFPMTLVLPMVAIFSITGEWSQRTGLTTFTLVPHRGTGAAGQGDLVGRRRRRRHGVRARGGRRGQPRGHRDRRDRPGVGRLGRRVRQHRAGQPVVPADRDDAGDPRPQLGGGAGRLLRDGPGPPDHRRHPDRQPAVVRRRPTLGRPQLGTLVPLRGDADREQWAQVGVTTAVWLVLPALLGLRLVMRSEVK